MSRGRIWLNSADAPSSAPCPSAAAGRSCAGAVPFFTCGPSQQPGDQHAHHPILSSVPFNKEGCFRLTREGWGGLGRGTVLHLRPVPTAQGSPRRRTAQCSVPSHQGGLFHPTKKGWGGSNAPNPISVQSSASRHEILWSLGAEGVTASKLCSTLRAEVQRALQQALGDKMGRTLSSIFMIFRSLRSSAVSSSSSCSCATHPQPQPHPHPHPQSQPHPHPNPQPQPHPHQHMLVVWVANRVK